jgi:uncharacterized membrane protein
MPGYSLGGKCKTYLKRKFAVLQLPLFFATLLFSVILLPLLEAQSSSSTVLPGTGQDDPLTIKIAVIGPGDQLYFWWGHIGLIIEDRETGISRFYDWGVFSFETQNFFYDFAFGRLLYTCSVTPSDWNIRNYIERNRDVTLYTLNLLSEKKEEIRHYAEWTTLPENKDYFYHHFNDNCATRIRDIIDMATDGQFSAKYKNTPGRFTLRQHVRRHTWFSPFSDWLLNFLMGQGIDKPIRVWDEMFLPSEIATRIQEFSYLDSNGNEQKIIQSIEIVNKAVNRPAVLEIPRRQWPRELIAGSFIALMILILIWLKSIKNSIVAHFSWALFQGALGLFFGIAGSVLFFMTFFTDHDYTYRNINVLFTNPLLLSVVPMGILYCTGFSSGNNEKWGRRIKTVWSCVFVLGIISIIINVLFLGQQNKVDLAIFLPIAAALSWLPDLIARKFSHAEAQRRGGGKRD